jgi:biopolymer transport protein TolR
MGMQSTKKKGPISEINVTPLVDVMLVLLIIFMVTAPLMFSGIQLKLPKTKKVNNLNLTEKQVILSVTPSGEFYLGKEKILYQEIFKLIPIKMKENNTDVLYIRADYALKYGAVAKLMSELKRNGLENLALVTEIEN